MVEMRASRQQQPPQESGRIFFALLLGCLLLISSAPAPKSLKIVVLGDSVTEGYGIDKSAAWPEVLEARLAKEFTPAPEIINAGISGSTSASAPARLKWLMKSNIDLLIIALGGNDGLRGVAPKETRKNLDTAITLAKSAKIPVILAGMMLPPNYGPQYTKEFKELFTDLAQSQQVTLIPFLLEGVGGEKSLNLADGIHPNEKGHQKVAELVYKTVAPELRKLMKGKTP